MALRVLPGVGKHGLSGPLYNISFTSARVEGAQTAERVFKAIKLSRTTFIRLESQGRRHTGDLKLEFFTRDGTPCDQPTWRRDWSSGGKRRGGRLPTTKVAPGETSEVVGGVRFSLQTAGKDHTCVATLVEDAHEFDTEEEEEEDVEEGEVPPAWEQF